MAQESDSRILAAKSQTKSLTKYEIYMKKKKSDTENLQKSSTSLVPTSKKSARIASDPKPRANGNESKSKPGRPSIFSQSIADKICARMEAGESLRSICRREKMPSLSAVCEWLADGKHNEFVEQYALAREAMLESHAEEIMKIADESVFRMEDGSIDSGMVQKQRLQIDARKWILSKLLPKKYGDKVGISHGGNISLTVVTGVPEQTND